MQSRKGFIQRIVLCSLFGLVCAASLSAVPADSAHNIPASPRDWDSLYLKTPLQWMQEYLGRLELTPEQVRQIVDIFKGHASELIVVTAEQVAARRALNLAIHQCATKERDVRLACVSVAMADVHLNLLRTQIFSEVYPVLNESQWAELQSMSAIAQGWIVEAIGRCGTEAPHPALEALKSLIAARLGLTEEQLAQFQAIADAHRPTICAMIGQEAAARKTLLDAVRKATPDTAAVTAASAAVSQLDLALSLERATIFSEVCAVLTDEQRAQVAALVERVQDFVQKVLDILAGYIPQLTL